MLAIPMAERAHDWFRQAEADLRLARSARDAGHYEWSPGWLPVHIARVPAAHSVKPAFVSASDTDT